MAPRQSPQILTNFQLEQLAGNVRLVDADGSVYMGSMIAQTQNQDNALGAPSLNFTSTDKSAGAPTEQTRQFYKIEAAGTNALLRLPVEIRANYIANPSPAELANVGAFGASAESARLLRLARSPTNAAKAQLEGVAIIGATNQVQLRAITYGP